MCRIETVMDTHDDTMDEPLFVPFDLEDAVANAETLLAELDALLSYSQALA